mmetsp:Transcript_26258/g.36120  ORF Transcript_26258/g.36120 Transcript_26258/m.36120 type:complete len:139 (+) Transcript_26258:218-634(+)
MVMRAANAIFSSFSPSDPPPTDDPPICAVGWNVSLGTNGQARAATISNYDNNTKRHTLQYVGRFKTGFSFELDLNEGHSECVFGWNEGVWDNDGSIGMVCAMVGKHLEMKHKGSWVPIVLSNCSPLSDKVHFFLCCVK